ncbi:hypothetical protein Tco_0800757 [Tanacetum coccineum]|uniref:Uncharacterized protein n=1 Tax=Tanacetum coccineum TaxID=301880 RepID=A0ABQ4ZU25_9ASTR
MVGYKQSQLKNKSFVEIQKLFHKSMTRVNMFVDKDIELVKESSKKSEAEMAKESSLKEQLVTEEDVAINVIPLATKPAPIINFQIHRKGRNGYYEIMRADGSAKTYLLFSQLLKEFDREDLENLWKLVKAKHGNTRPEKGYERVLWGDLKTIFEHNIEDEVWRSLQGKKVLLWRLYDSCGVHFVSAAQEESKIDDSDQDAEVTLVDETQGRHDDAQMFDTDVFDDEEVFVAKQSEKVVEEVVSTAEVSVAVTITSEEINLAQELVELRSAKPNIVVQEPVQSTTTTAPSAIPRAKGIVFHEQEQAPTPIVSLQQPTHVKDKGKGKMVEEEPMKKMSKTKLLKLDEELAFKLQVEEEEQARLAREKAEKVEKANISWDNVQPMIEADRKKHFVALRAQEKRNKPPTKAQKKSIMSTNLKHMAGYKQSQLKNKSFAEIQKLFDKAMTRVNMFVDKDTELVKESSKKAEAEMVEESSSKRVEEDVAINVIPLASKPAPIVNFQIHRKGRNGYNEIIRADESAKTYLLFSQLLKEFDREDLENLWKLVIAKHGNTRPKEGYERVLWGDLKTMFEHNTEDEVQSSLQGKKVLLWRLYDSCGIHFVKFEDMHLKGIRLEREKVEDDIASMVAEAVDTFLRNYMSNHILHVHPTESASSSILDLQQQLYLKMKDDEQAKTDAICTRDHEDRHDDDARPKGESSAKRQKTSEHGTYTRGELSSSQATDESILYGSDDDEVPSKEVSPELLADVSGKGMTTDDQQRMQDAVNDIMRSQFGLIYENNKKEKKIMDIKEISKFYDATLKRVLEKVKRFNLDVKHGYADPDLIKDNAEHMMFYEEYIQERLRHRDQMRHWESYKIVEVIRIQYDQGYGQEFTKKIIVKRANGEMCSFSESDYKYLNNDIEDLYLMEKVHDYQLRLESYKLKVNLTAPKLTFSGIKDQTPYTIIALPFIGLIYENSKKEKRVMDIDNIPKFCDATLKGVENVKKINLDVKHGYKDPPLSNEDAELMKFYEVDIQERLKHQDQMRRWESYVNGRPI